MSAITLRVGAEVQWQGSEWKLVAFREQGMLILRSVLGEQAATDLAGLVGDSTFSCGARPRSPLDATAIFDALPAAMRRDATERLAHLHEARTGYRSGHPGDALAEEPRLEYDPDLSGLTDRMRRKASELSVHPDTLYDWWKRVTDPAGDGMVELIDRRRVRHALSHDRLDWRLQEAIEVVVSELSQDRASKVGQAEKRRRVRQVVRSRFADADVKTGSDSTLDRRIAQVSALPGRRAIHNQPNQRPMTRTPYRSLITTRPGEVVLIDSTKLNFMLLDPATMVPTRAWLTTAQDHFSRCIVAARVTCGQLASEEASLLLADMVRPRAWRNHWPERARWRYHGIPDTIVASLREEWHVEELAAKPPLLSEMLVVDGAWATKSHAFWEACCHIGSDLQLARPYTPTDKAQMERFYGTINRWQQAMPGHVGRNATERGVGVERDAYYLPVEAEDLFWQFVLGVYHCTEHAGLSLPEAPEHPVSPNRMYDVGVATSGMVRLPPDPDIYFEILPTQWRAVQKGSGVSIDGLPYANDVTEALCNYGSSPYPGKPNVWPFRQDRRDRSQIYVKAPGEGWRSVPCTRPMAHELPFGQTATHAAKCLPLLTDDDGFLTRREEGAQTDAWIDGLESDRGTQPTRPAGHNDRTRAAAQDRDETSLKDREVDTRRRRSERMKRKADLGDFSPTIYDAGDGQ